jgi:TRAP-type C4-dicarboxylate transport system permease small subunit
MIRKILAQVDIQLDQLDIPTDVTTDSDRVQAILQVVFATLGAIAFLVIVIAGLQFVLSRGEPEKAAKARRTIIYAAVGLVVAVLAFSIIGFITESVA